MKTKLVLCLASITFLLSSLLVPGSVYVYSQPAVNFKVGRVVWGQDLNAPAKAYPGNTGVYLTVEVQNYSNDTIKGVEATLRLTYPFTDANGKLNATTSGQPVDVGNVMNQTSEILAVGFFTLTFSLNVDPNATPALYNCNMTLNYFVKSQGYIRGTPRAFTIGFAVSKSSTTMTCTASPQQIERGETVDVTGSISPAQENVTVTLVYKRENGSRLNRTVRTTSSGSYKDSYQPDVEGVWMVNASWVGERRYEGSWASASVEVIYPVSVKVSTSENRLVGGLDNFLNITIVNSGGVSLSTIGAALTIPAPLVVQGGNQWDFKYLDSKSSIIIPLKVFAPAGVIGSTYQGQLQLSYRDTYGQSHSETFPVSLIVVGRIELVVYNKVVSPKPSSSGGRFAVTATLLNKGNVKATYTNASILPNPVFELSDESTTYVGDVEENSPVPFTVMAKVNPDVENGTYPATITISYRDDQYREHVLTFTTSLVVERTQTGQSNSSSGWSLLTFLREVGLTLATLVGASVVILILYRRRLSNRLRGVKHTPL